jgi:2-polyprenyl-3-methyl-5-hydroxy-6-metoxy-1,4-benzoquinol methylase
MADSSENMSAAVRAAWESNAEWWDDYIGREGNEFHRTLVAPAQMRLLALTPGERVLEVACGNGQFAREMARAGAIVVASDFSEKFVERARQHTSAERIANVEFHVADATDERQIRALSSEPFDAAVCTMAMMDMSDLTPMLRAVRSVLRATGRFVFSVTHPCFQTEGARMFVEREDRDGEMVTVHGLRISRYLTQETHRGLGIIGQPEPHYYFDRPLSVLFGDCFAAGFLLDAIEEPSFVGREAPERPFSWDNYPEIPPVLVARLRPSAT